MVRWSKLILIIIFIALNGNTALARIGNTVAQNRSAYGKETSIEAFGDSSNEASYTGYRSYSTNDGKIVGFFVNGKERSEHLIPKRVLNRAEVRNLSGRMYPHSLRGNYRRKLTRYKAEGHFFDAGLVAYEYHIVNKATKGYNGIKVLLYERNKKYWQINPKAYI